MLPNGNLAELYSRTSCLFTDGIGALLEYQVTGRPIIFLESSDHVPFNPVGDRVIEGVYRSEEINVCLDLINHFGNGGSHKLANVQSEIIDELSNGKAAEMVLDVIGEQLELNAQSFVSN